MSNMSSGENNSHERGGRQPEDAGHIADQLNDYFDGELSAEDAIAVERHLAECPACRESLSRLGSLVKDVRRLSSHTEPSRDLWPGIRDRLTAGPDGQSSIDVAADGGTAPDGSAPPLARIIPMPRRWLLPAAASLLLAGLVLAWLVIESSRPGWDVTTLAGRPALDKSGVSGKAKIRAGQWLETDGQSRALLDVGSIGRVEVGPDTRLQIRETKGNDHRLALEEGSIEAMIWAPPRLFFVETPAALATDLGCAYTLTVDSLGTSLLHVTSGYVELERDGQRSLVPAGTMCRARRGIGPGTPFDEDASPDLVAALTRFDFENGGSPALRDALDASRPGDVVTLWQLVRRTDGADRAAAYDRLVEFVEPPVGISRDSVLAGTEEAMYEWEFQLGLYVEDYLPLPDRVIVDRALEGTME